MDSSFFYFYIYLEDLEGFGDQMKQTKIVSSGG